MPDPESVVSWSDPGRIALVPAWLVVSQVSAPAVRVYAYVSLHAGLKPPSRKDVMAALQLSDRGTVSAFKELVAVGAIARVGRHGWLLNLTATVEEQPAPAALPALRQADAEKPPAIIKIDGRNLPLDALCQVCEISDGSPRIAAAVAALNGRLGAKGITHLYWSECRRVAFYNDGGLTELAQLSTDNDRYCRLLVQAIHAKAAQIKRKQPWRDTLTPQIIRDLWLDIDRMQGPRPKSGLTADEMRALG